MGVSFEEGGATIGDGEDNPVPVDIAVSDGRGVSGILNLFAATPEGVVAVALD